MWCTSMKLRRPLVILVLLWLVCCFAAREEAAESIDLPNDSASRQGSGGLDELKTLAQDGLCPPNTIALLKWGLDQKFISAKALPLLVSRCKELAVENPSSSLNETMSEPGLFWRAWSSVSSKFTLLNVLYTGGALLVIGAMTLFMTLGWEIFGGAGICGIATMYGALFAVLGRYFYEGPKGGEWEVVCCLLFIMTLFMTPLAVYGAQRALGLWPVGVYNSGFSNAQRIPMTLWVVAVSLAILLLTKYSFFIAPVALGAWLWSVDSNGYFLGNYNSDADANATLGVGSIMIAVAVVMDKFLDLGGSTGGTDFTAWLYPIAVTAFWAGLSFRKPSSDANGVLYLCINVFLVFAGQFLDRFFLILFGSVGVLLYSWVTLYDLKIGSSRFIVLRFLLALVLLASSLKYGSQVAFWSALAGIITWNTSNALRINDSEPYYLLQFVINFSINQGSWEVFGERVLSFYLFEIRCVTLLYLATLYGMLCFYASITASSRGFRVYRLILSYLFMIATLAYPVLGIVGSVGISGFIFVEEFLQPYNYSVAKLSLYYSFGLSLLVASYLADSRVIYLQGLLICTFYLGGDDIYRSRWLSLRNCIFSVVVILFSVVVESQVLLLLGGIGVFLYLSYLAKRVFRNSLLFPFALTGLGMAIIFIGVQYQKYQGAFRGMLLALTPATASSCLQTATRLGVSVADVMKGYVGFLSNGLAQLAEAEHYVIPAIIAACFVLVLLLKLYNRLFNTLKSTTPIVKVTEAYIYWPKDTEDHGVVIWVHGTKPEDFTLSQAELHINGDSMWRALEVRFGGALVSTFKFTFYPLKLCSGYLDASKFKKGQSTFDVELHLGTGKLGGRRISHNTLRDALQKLERQSYDPFFEMQIQYTRRFGMVRGVLFSFPSVRCSDFLKAEGSTNGTKL